LETVKSKEENLYKQSLAKPNESGKFWNLETNSLLYQIMISNRESR